MKTKTILQIGFVFTLILLSLGVHAEKECGFGELKCNTDSLYKCDDSGNWTLYENCTTTNSECLYREGRLACLNEGTTDVSGVAVVGILIALSILIYTFIRYSYKSPFFKIDNEPRPKTCHYCGKKLAIKDNFCNRCGKKIVH